MPVKNLQGTHEGLGAGANVVICGACDEARVTRAVDFSVLRR